MSISQDEIEEALYAKRQINRDLYHAIDHIKNGDIELALNILKSELEREKKAKRK